MSIIQSALNVIRGRSNAPPSPSYNETIRLRDQILMEANFARQSQHEIWDRNQNRYMGLHWEKLCPPGRMQFVNNRIQTAVLTQSSVQTSVRPRFSLIPVNTQKEPTFHLSEAGAMKAVKVGLPTVQPGQQLPANVVAQLLAIRVPDPMSGQPGFLFDGNTDLIAVDDLMAAQALQTVSNAYWDRDYGDYILAQNVVLKGIYGHQAMLVQAEPANHRVFYYNVHPKNVWMQPGSSWTFDSDYVIVAYPMSQDRLTSLYPDRASDIMKVTGPGNVASSAGGGTVFQLGAPWRNQNYQRPMGILWKLWLRESQTSLNPDQALASQQVLANNGQLVSSKDGNPVTPNDKARWPQTHMLREIIMVNDMVISDGPCPYRDIPVCWNVNLPNPWSPYGIGLPERLEDLQQLINRFMSNMHDHYKYFCAPQTVAPLSAKKDMEGMGLFARPDRTTFVDDDLFVATRGKPLNSIDPPTFSQAAVNALAVALSEFKEQANFPDVLGGTSKSGDSGKKVEALQAAAKTVIGFSSMFTEMTMEHALRLTAGAAVDIMPQEDFQQIIGVKAPGLLNALRTRASEMDFNVQVEIIGGRGTQRDLDLQKAMQAYQMCPTQATLARALELLEVPDPQGTASRYFQQMAMQAQMAPPLTSGTDKGTNTSSTADVPPSKQASNRKTDEVG